METRRKALPHLFRRRRDLPVVSVVVNNFNYARYLPAAIESALGQLHARTEVIVVDDGSTDGSRAVIDRYAARIRAILQDNCGQAAALNAGFEASTGDVVLFLDADDLLLPHATQVVAGLFESPDVTKAHWALWEIDERGGRTGRLKPERLPAEGDWREHTAAHGPLNITSPPTSGNAFSRSVLERLLPIPEDHYRICADAYLALLATACGPIRRSVDPLSCWRRHNGNRYNNAVESLEERTAKELERYSRLAHDLRACLERMGVAADPRLWERRSGVFKRLERVRNGMQRIAESVPAGGKVVLFDDWDWDQDASGRPVFRDREVVRPFELESRWPTSKSDTEVVAEVRRLAADGADHVAFVWPGTWWRDHYAGLRALLGESGQLRSERGALVFELDAVVGRRPLPRAPREPDAAQRTRLAQVEARMAVVDAEVARLRRALVREDSVDATRRAVASVAARDAEVAVISRGDEALLELPPARARHFPASEDGCWTGYHPADSSEAIEQLEAARASGVDYLVIPETSRWWLDHYEGFREHLDRQYSRAIDGDAGPLVFALARRAFRRHSRQPRADALV